VTGEGLRIKRLLARVCRSWNNKALRWGMAQVLGLLALLVYE
jgi:hypothetical protein